MFPNADSNFVGGPVNNGPELQLEPPGNASDHRFCKKPILLFSLVPYIGYNWVWQNQLFSVLTFSSQPFTDASKLDGHWILIQVGPALIEHPKIEIGLYPK